MTRLTPLILAVALLGCRDTSGLEVDALSVEIAELTARLEALEADAAAGDPALLDMQASAAATELELADLRAEVEALASVDLTETLAAIDDVDERVGTLEEAGLATESWVETQAYMTQEAGTTLDVRIAANADASDANADLIASNSTTLSTQLTSILANASAASTNAQALSSLDGRVGIAEAVAAQAQTDAGRIDAALLTLAGEVSDLDDGVDGLEGAVDSLTDRVETAEAAVDGADGQLTALAQADSALELSIDAVSGELAAAVADISSNRSSITSNTDGLADAMTARQGLALDISANTDLVAGVADDVALNLGFIESNMTAIDANTTATQDNAVGVELAMDGVTELEQQVAASTGEVDDILARLDLVEVYTHTEWVSANTADGRDSGVIAPMQVTITKQLADSILYAEYDDNLRVYGSGGQACRWEIYFNGQRCTSPGPVAGDVYLVTGNSHKQHEVSGYCRGTNAGEFGASDVALSVRVSSSPGYNSDCYTGWQSDQLGVLRVTEAVDAG